MPRLMYSILIDDIYVPTGAPAICLLIYMLTYNIRSAQKFVRFIEQKSLLTLNR